MTTASGKTGKIHLVGLGPGDAQYLAPAASQALAESDVIVGFRAYIQQIEGLTAGKDVVSMELGQELERAEAAVDSAYAGNTVAVVSAMQAAAAVLGSPLMQDFCAISLSDLLTPWAKIRGRLEAAGQGDFVVALYNPRSQRRQTQLLEAQEILLKHRPGDTPVGIVGDAFRPGQRVKITSLQDLEKDAESVDMVTIVVIGNSTTYLHSGKVITPRGYEEKTRAR